MVSHRRLDDFLGEEFVGQSFATVLQTGRVVALLTIALSVGAAFAIDAQPDVGLIPPEHRWPAIAARLGLALMATAGFIATYVARGWFIHNLRAIVFLSSLLYLTFLSWMDSVSNGAGYYMGFIPVCLAAIAFGRMRLAILSLAGGMLIYAALNYDSRVLLFAGLDLSLFGAVLWFSHRQLIRARQREHEHRRRLQEVLDFVGEMEHDLLPPQIFMSQSLRSLRTRLRLHGDRELANLISQYQMMTYAELCNLLELARGRMSISDYVQGGYCVFFRTLSNVIGLIAARRPATLLLYMKGASPPAQRQRQVVEQGGFWLSLRRVRISVRSELVLRMLYNLLDNATRYAAGERPEIHMIISLDRRAGLCRIQILNDVMNGDPAPFGAISADGFGVGLRAVRRLARASGCNFEMHVEEAGSTVRADLALPMEIQ